MASLDSVRQKVVRSKIHLNSLDGETQRYFDLKPCEVMPEEEANSGRIILRFKEKIPVPVAIPLIIGDALQNLRSALDYLVWELVLAANGNPTNKHMFPICDTHDAFKEQVRRGRLDGIAPDAIAEIEGLQPFNTGQDTERAVLRILDTFTNINKHRRLLLAALATHHSQTEFIGTQSGHSVQNTLTPRYDNAEIAVGPAPILGDEMEVKGDALFFITFQERPCEGCIYQAVLNQLWHFVNESVVPKFERFFV